MKRNDHIEVSINSNEFSPEIKEEMWAIYRNYYNYHKADFMARIASNNYYALFKLHGRIIGFAGLRINKVKIARRSRLLIYFGQVVIHENYRGKSIIPIVGAKLCMKYWRELIFSKAYFWADSLTYKAYLVFAKTLDECYPSYKRQTPRVTRRLLHYIGRTYYRKTYNHQTGTVTKKQMLINDPSIRITAKYRQDSDINFYITANPNYKIGHGLLTIAPINGRNILLLLRRYLQRIAQRRKTFANREQPVIYRQPSEVIKP